MATRALLADLVRAWHAAGGTPVEMTAVGGVDAAHRVAAGEALDLVVLAADALDDLIARGHVRTAGRRDLVRSEVVVAVREGAPRPDIGSAEALRRALQSARSIGYSTGPSGTALVALFERWGLREALQGRLVQARPGVPVGTLVAQGEAEIGFQQRSELVGLPGITVLGPLPPGLEIVTTFSAACCSVSTRPEAVQPLLDFLHSPAADDTKRRHGMTPAP